MTGLQVLSIRMQENNAGAVDIHDYLRGLLSKLWEEGEGFSGKRPFGNSGWEYELYKALLVAKAVGGKVDEFGDIEDVDTKAANKLIFDAIGCL